MDITGNEIASEKVWLVTGASTGFGRELVEHLLASGARVVATARKVEGLQELGTKYPKTALVASMDVTNQKQVESVVGVAVKWFGRIDVLVNNAGYGMVGAVEESAEEEFRPMFETNVFGLIRVTQAVLPQMRTQGSGHIVNLSSIGGLVATPGFGLYNATKFAVEGLSEALAQEVQPLGITVTIVEPGPFRTKFLGKAGGEAKARISDYDKTAGKMRAYFTEQDGKQAGDPQKAAEAIVKAVESEHPPLHLLLGGSTIPRVKGKIEALQKDLAAWESTTIGADYPQGQ
jgi:NAD(P)-dependent dehydrogenase (short-subunit alcohol dehydrogenase family)